MTINSKQHLFVKLGNPNRFNFNGSTLDLKGKSLTDKDMPDVIATLTAYPFINEVNLSNNNIGPTGAKYIAKHNRTAKKVNLSLNNLGASGAKLFVIYNKIATDVSLRSNRISSYGIKMLAVRNKKIITLDIANNYIDTDGIIAFAKKNRCVQTINIDGNPIDQIKAASISKAFNKLQMVTTPSTDLNPHQSEEQNTLSLLKANPLRFSNSIIQNKLNLSHRCLDDKDIYDVIALLNNNPQIDNIDLSHNRFGSEAAKILAKYNTTVKKVNFSFNYLGAEGASVFAEYNKYVTSLDLSCNNIDFTGIEKFAKKNTAVTQLNLSNNHFNRYDIASFAINNTVVTELNLSNNKLGNQGTESFATYNNKVTKLILRGNHIDYQGVKNFHKLKKIDITVDFSENLLSVEEYKKCDKKWNPTFTSVKKNPFSMWVDPGAVSNGFISYGWSTPAQPHTADRKKIVKISPEELSSTTTRKNML